jgi:hypothetical protein
MEGEEQELQIAINSILQEASTFELQLRTPTTSIGGRLARHFPFWRSISSDPYVWSLILGVRIDFTVLPTQAISCVAERSWSADQIPKIQAFIDKLLLTDVIVETVESPADLVFSPIFLVTNHDSSERLILDVSRLNKECFRKKHFKMETLHTILPEVTRGAWMLSLDLVQGFYNVRLDTDFQKYFAFKWKGRQYKFRALVMGFSDSPRIFSIIVKTLANLGRRLGFQIHHFLDDTILIGDSRDEVTLASRVFGTILQKSGFFIHPDKSVFEPTQKIMFLGFLVDSVKQVLELPTEKFDRIQTLIQAALASLNGNTRVSIRDMAKLVGYLNSCLPAVPYGEAHYKLLERAKEDALGFSRDFDRLVLWPSYVRDELVWWAKLRHPSSKPFRDRLPDFIFATDASLTGWGVVADNFVHFEAWDLLDSQDIAELELLAVWKALAVLPFELQGKTLLARVDNQIAVHYVNAGGGRCLKLNSLASAIWAYCEQKQAHILALYIPSAENPADAFTRVLSRNEPRFVDTEGMLRRDLFDLVYHWAPQPPTMDWFASPENHQLPRFCSWHFSSGAVLHDAFLQHWNLEVGYMFPPFSLLPRVLRKVQDEAVTTILIAPNWPGAPWTPVLHKCKLCSFDLPQAPPLLVFPSRPHLLHPMKHLRLTAFFILKGGCRDFLPE